MALDFLEALELTITKFKQYVDKKFASCEIEIDDTLTTSGVAADAKAVGDALATKQPVGDYALTSDIPTGTSDLTNDSGFLNCTDATLTESGKAADAKAVGDALATKQPTGNYALKSDIPTAISELTNDSGFLSYTDVTLTESGVAADAKAVGDALAEFTNIELDTTLTVKGKAPDSKVVGDTFEALPIKIANDGYTNINGLRRTTNMDFSEYDDGVFYESVSGYPERYAYYVEFDEQKRPVKITDEDGNTCVITW